MKFRIFYTFILILITSFATCQTSYLKSYPFNKSSKVQLVIFSVSEPINEDWSKIVCLEIPKKNGVVDTLQLENRKTLNSMQIEKVYEAMNFKGTDCSENVYRKKECNESGYGILFYNSKGEVFEYIELCFNCMQFTVSSKNVNLGLMCYDKYSQFEKLFNENGLQVIRYRDE